jgi:hypothetical protein
MPGILIGRVTSIVLINTSAYQKRPIIVLGRLTFRILSGILQPFVIHIVRDSIQFQRANIETTMTTPHVLTDVTLQRHHLSSSMLHSVKRYQNLSQNYACRQPREHNHTLCAVKPNSWVPSLIGHTAFISRLPKKHSRRKTFILLTDFSIKRVICNYHHPLH